MTSSTLTPKSEYIEAQNFEFAMISDETFPIRLTSFLISISNDRSQNIVGDSETCGQLLLHVF